MSFDLTELRARIAATGPVARVVIAEIRGSSPREVGAAMLVWPGGQSGSIGGGALEWQAAQAARAMLPDGGARLSHVALGPALGQCCGGAVTLLTEVWDAAALAALPQAEVIARPARPGVEMPLAVRRMLKRARATGEAPPPRLIQGWMVEPVTRPARHLWIWGAGHVGRALVSVLAPLPGVALSWADTGQDRFPAEIPANVTALAAANPADLVPHAPVQAEHLILTYSHALDLELCHRLLSHGFRGAGLIGSATKWARFQSRLRQLGHTDAQIRAITCPIGDPDLGKHPQAIAVGVAAALLRAESAVQSTRKGAG